ARLAAPPPARQPRARGRTARRRGTRRTPRARRDARDVRARAPAPGPGDPGLRPDDGAGPRRARRARAPRAALRRPPPARARLGRARSRTRVHARGPHRRGDRRDASDRAHARRAGPLPGAAGRAPGRARGARRAHRGRLRPPRDRRERARVPVRRAAAARGAGTAMTPGLANPAGALALGAVGVLVVLHLYGRRRRTVPVGTLFLWQRVPAEPLDRRRFRPDLLFVLQLVLLLALIAGLVRPYVESATPAAERVRLLVVLDVSASMQAREEGGTRFELARRRARALVAQLLTGDEVMLVAAAERAHVVLAWTVDHARAQDRLEALEPLDTPTNLAAGLELALGELHARPETQVAVLTDLPPEASAETRAELALVDWIQVGHTDDNVAIAGVSVEAPPFRPAHDATATVLVRNYAHAARRVVLEAHVGTEVWARRELALGPRASEPVLLVDPPATGEVTL